MTWAFPIIIAYAVAGGFWRRVLGGWLGLPRWIAVMMLPALASPLIRIHWVAWLVVSLWMMVFWLPGHKFDDWKALCSRYGGIGLIWTVCQKWWPDHWRLGGFIDGWSSAAEVFAGAVVFGGFAAIAVLL